MNFKKIIACSLLCGMLFSEIPVNGMDAPVKSKTEPVSLSDSEYEADSEDDPDPESAASTDKGARSFSFTNGNHADLRGDFPDKPETAKPASSDSINPSSSSHNLTSCTSTRFNEIVKDLVGDDTTESVSFKSELSRIYNIFYGDGALEDSDTISKAYCDIVLLMNDNRSFSELMSIHNLLNSLDSSNRVTQIAKSMCETYMNLCCLNITQSVDQLEHIVSEINQDKLLDDVMYSNFYTLIHKIISSTVVRIKERAVDIYCASNRRYFKYLPHMLDLDDSCSEDSCSEEEADPIPGYGSKAALFSNVPLDYYHRNKIIEALPVKAIDLSIMSLNLEVSLCKNASSLPQHSSFVPISDHSVSTEYETFDEGTVKLYQKRYTEFITSFIKDKFNSKTKEVRELCKAVNTLYVAQLRDKINASDCSEENKQCLSNYIDAIKNLCELYEDFSGTESCDYEKTENRLKFLSDFNNGGDWKPDCNLLKDFIKFGHILNTVKGRIIANRMENDDDFKDLFAAFAELIIYRSEEGNIFIVKDGIVAKHNEIIALLESYKIEEKILMSSMSEENKTYLINYVKYVKFCYKSILFSNRMYEVITLFFVPIVDCNKALDQCKIFINFLILDFDENYNRCSQSVSKNKLSMEFLEVLDFQINEAERNISLSECSDENKQDLRRYVEVIKSLNELSKEYSYANQPYNREKVESTLEKLNGVFETVGWGSQIFIEFLNIFNHVKKCLQYSNLANDSDFKDFDSALVELGKYVIDRNGKYDYNLDVDGNPGESEDNLDIDGDPDEYDLDIDGDLGEYDYDLDAVNALLKDLPQIEEKISKSSLTDEQKNHLINRIRNIFTLYKGYKLYSVNKWDEARSTYKEFIDKFDPGIDEFNLILRDFVEKMFGKIDNAYSANLILRDAVKNKDWIRIFNLL